MQQARKNGVDSLDKKSDPLISESRNSSNPAIRTFRNLSSAAVNSNRSLVREQFEKRVENQAQDQKKSDVPEAEVVPEAVNAAQNPQQGDLSGAANESVTVAKTAGGSWLVNFLWYSCLEIFPGALYGLPALTIYMLIGVFSKDVTWHQLAKWQMAVVILLDLTVIVLIFVLVVATLYSYCYGLTGAVTKAASSAGIIPDYCSAFK